MNPVQPRIEPWPIAIAAFFGVVISALATWAVVAQRNREELVSADYYEQEVAYQQQIHRLNRSADAGVSIGYVDGIRGGVIRIAWPEASRPAQGPGKVRLYRPSEAALDREIPLAVDAVGVQTIDAKPLKPGLWKVRVHWGPEDAGYYVEGSVVVPPSVAMIPSPAAARK
jgi:nitrogen fixation protein FixH